MIISQNSPGQCNGVILANSSSSNLPISYLWSNGSTLNNIFGLCAGIYSVTIADSVGCQIIDSVYIGVFGCTDSTALNYDSLANFDDGSCCFISGCTNIFADNYDSLACFDDGSCYSLWISFTINCY